MRIAGRQIGEGHPCFVIAEAGVNHNGSLELAKQLVEAAAHAGADAVKFQTFQAEKVISAGTPKAEYQKQTTGSTEQQLEMVRRLEMPEPMTRSVAARAASMGITFLSTAFDEQSVDLLDDIGVPVFKVGSGDVTNLPLVEFIGRHVVPGRSEQRSRDAACGRMPGASAAALRFQLPGRSPRSELESSANAERYVPRGDWV
jgi:N,N'-diacetyllegionaminate synthase